jgi:hypothetical protein
VRPASIRTTSAVSRSISGRLWLTYTDRHGELVAQALDIRQGLVLPWVVERGKRLVHEEEARRGEKGAADRDALLLAAGKAVRPPVEERIDAEELRDLFHLLKRSARGVKKRP